MLHFSPLLPTLDQQQTDCNYRPESLLKFLFILIKTIHFQSGYYSGFP